MGKKRKNTATGASETLLTSLERHRARGVPMVRIADLVPWSDNPRDNAPAVPSVVASLQRFGWTSPVLYRADGGMVEAGHTRLLAARHLGITEVPAIALDHDERSAQLYALADNRLNELAPWTAGVADVMAGFEAQDLEVAGWSDPSAWLVDQFGASVTPAGGAAPTPAIPSDDNIPGPPANPVTRVGDVWTLGDHRLLCGDSTSSPDVARLLAGQIVDLVHADPPYGMGKEDLGVANDDLTGPELDRFQMAWWSATLPHVAPNGSLIVWGTAPDLWRLWYQGGLGNTPDLAVRNEIVWFKGNQANGIGSAGRTMWATVTERALFAQFGPQHVKSPNVGDFPESWAPIQTYLAGEASGVGLTDRDVQRLCGCGMFGHWFTRSQFNMIPERHYLTLQSTYPGRFRVAWQDLKRDWDKVKSAHSAMVRADRSYFDNERENMTEVWECRPVLGADRLGHATPKPAALMVRAVATTCPPGGLVLEPFGGSGTTLVAAQSTGRRCHTLELQPGYCDVIVERWQTLTGGKATRSNP